MHAVTWSNGSTTRARTWRELFDKVRAEQWRELTENEFRDELAKRCWIWSETSIDVGAPYRELFRELQRAGLVVIEGEK